MKTIKAFYTYKGKIDWFKVIMPIMVLFMVLVLVGLGINSANRSRQISECSAKGGIPVINQYQILCAKPDKYIPL